MVQIAINEKKIEFVTIEALRIHGETYQCHEELRAIGKTGVPVIFNRGRIYDGSTQCIKFVDYEFEPYDILMPIKNSVDINDAVNFIHESIAHPYYKMLLRQTEDLQQKEKDRFLDFAYILSQQVKQPYFNGDQFTIADITIAPFFERMFVLEHYRNFKIPEESERYSKWYEWQKNVMARQSVQDSLNKDKEKLLKAYERYANDKIKNNWYKRIQEEDEKAREDQLKPLPPKFKAERKKWL